MTLEGEYDGDRYVIESFKTDYGEDGWFVQREGGERYEVRSRPASCTCGDFMWRRDGLLPVPCRHIRAARQIVGEQ